jgi:hypothetical protein
MAGNQKNILIGAAAFWVSIATNDDPAGLPARPSMAGTSPLAPSGTDWRDVGFTTEGVEVAYAPDYGDVEVDQLLDSAKIFKQGIKVTVNTTFAEATLENLLVVWGQSEDASGGSVDIFAGALGDQPVERSLLFIGVAPRTDTNARQERVYHVVRAIQTESTSHALRRTEMTGLPASFRCLPDPAASGGASYGSVTDRTLS